MIYLPKHDCKWTKIIGFDLCVYSNVYTFMYTNCFLKYVVSNMLFDPDNPWNTLLQIEVLFNIGSTIYIYIYII